MLQGKNLMILVNGSVIAGSKSCTVDVDADSLKVASPTDGEWEHILPGRKSWSISTNHLMPSVLGPKPLISGYSPSWINISDPVQVRVGGTIRNFAVDRGLTIFAIRKTSAGYIITKEETYDTGFDDASVTDMIEYLSEEYLSDPLVARVIVSHDYWAIPASLATAISQTLHVPDVPTLTARHGAIAIIGGLQQTTKGICIFADGHEGAARASAYLEGDVVQTVETVLKNAVARVGQMMTIRVQVDGYGDDYLTGTALCRSFSALGTNGNLLTGSFKFQGSGPLI